MASSTLLVSHTQKLTFQSSLISNHKLSLRSQNPFLSFPSYGHYKHRLVTRSPVMAKSSNKSDDHNDKKLLKVAVGASLALACALSIFSFKIKKMNYTNAAAAAGHPSAADMIISQKPTAAGSDYSGMYPLLAKSALRSLFEVSAMLASAKPIPSQKTSFNLQKLPSSPSKEDIDSIKMEAVRRMKEGKCEEAVQLLRDANMRFKNQPEADFNVQMALIEILILLERYQEAAEYSCLNDDNMQISDVRIPLYKAIIFTMIDKDTEAKQCWKEFRKSIGEGFDPSSFED